MTKEEKVKKFIEGLNNVAAETGILIMGCGCHDSPFLATNSTIQYYKDNGIKNMGDGQLYFDVEEMTYKLKTEDNI